MQQQREEDLVNEMERDVKAANDTNENELDKKAKRREKSKKDKKDKKNRKSRKNKDDENKVINHSLISKFSRIS